jgi:hypothetical protein
MRPWRPRSIWRIGLDRICHGFSEAAQQIERLPDSLEELKLHPRREGSTGLNVRAEEIIASARFSS